MNTKKSTQIYVKTCKKNKNKNGEGRTFSRNF